jgi:hypothetical protein
MRLQSVGLIGLVVLLTSSVACTLRARWRGLTYPALVHAVLKTLETVGAGAMFFVANITAGVFVIAVARFTGWFVSPYILGDVSLVGLSLLQGIVFAWWHGARAS